MEQQAGMMFSAPFAFTFTEDVKKGSLVRLKAANFDNLFHLIASSITVDGETMDLSFNMDPEELNNVNLWSYYRSTLPLAEFYAKSDIKKGAEALVYIQYRGAANITAGQKWTFSLAVIKDHDDFPGQTCSDDSVVEFVANEPVKMEAYLKSDGRLLIQYFDKYYNPAKNVSNRFTIEYNGCTVTKDVGQSYESHVIQLPADGLTRVCVKDDNGMEAVSNYYPVISGKNVYFSDFHWHSEFSDGQRPLDDIMRSCRYQLGLDFSGSGDHGGFKGNYGNGHTMAELKKIYEDIAEDGIFATLAGSELNARQGHVNAYAKTIDKYMDFVTDEPDKFALLVNNPYRYPLKEYNDAINDDEVMLIPHHTNTDSFNCGGFLGADGLPAWGAMPWPCNGSAYEHVRLIEMVQTSGSYETEDYQEGWKMSKNSGTLGGAARTALIKGFKVGFCGCSDAHNGWPTGKVGGPFCTGLTGVLSDELTSDAIFDNLYQRCCYATTGARIVAAARMDGCLMGSQIYQVPGQTRKIEIEIHGTAPIECVEIIHAGITLASLETDGSLDFYAIWEDERPGRALSEAWYYVRARQADGECVWLSPFFVDVKED